MKNEVISSVKIGENYSVLLPEIGVLFKQDLNQSIQEIKSAGCTIIKGNVIILISLQTTVSNMSTEHMPSKSKLSRSYKAILPLKVWEQLDYAMT